MVSQVLIGNVDEELPRLQKWLGHHRQVETSVDKGDLDFRQTGVM